MSTEIEMKLAMVPGDAERVLAHPIVTAALRGPPASKRLLSIYFDTPDLALHQHRVALRVRDKGGRWVQTLKTAGSGDDGLFVRRELECDVAGDRVEVEKVADDELRAWLVGLGDRLEAVFVTDFVRQKGDLELGDGCVAELCVDVGEVRAGEMSEPLSEVELELVTGDVEPLKRFSGELRAALGLRPDNRSKAERGYAAFERSKAGTDDA